MSADPRASRRPETSCLRLSLGRGRRSAAGEGTARSAGSRPLHSHTRGAPLWASVGVRVFLPSPSERGVRVRSPPPSGGMGAQPPRRNPRVGGREKQRWREEERATFPAPLVPRLPFPYSLHPLPLPPWTPTRRADCLGYPCSVPGTCFTHPLRDPFFLSETCSAYPLHGICLLPGPRDSNPRLSNKCKAGPGSPMGTQTRQIQAAPISARFKSRSWTALTQARKSRKKREKQCNSSQTHPAPEEAVWGPVRAVVVCSRIGQPSVRR